MSRPMQQTLGILPAERDSFVGRGREIGLVRGELSAHRSVTITGAGGVGKTRVALRVAHDLRRCYPDGVWLVELGNLRDPALLGHTVANALGVVVPSTGDVRAALADYLAPRQLLLLLDNCEHLPGDCADLVAHLLSACPELTVLATSREPLGVAAESVVPVPPLPVPERHGSLSLTAAPEYDSIALFTARATAAAPDFRLTKHNLPAVAHICHDLDGIPLAIELAAVRVRGLSVEQMSQRLSDRYRLLTAGRRDAPRRHQTLESCMQWSYELCSPAERLLWARAAVFVGGFEADAARAVCAGEGVDPGTIAELLDVLVDKSILNVDHRDGHDRYRMLETLREFGTAKLTPADSRTLHERFVDWYQGLAAQAEREWFSTRQVEWFARLDQEHANVQVALEWSLQQATPSYTEKALSMIANLFHYYWWGRAWQQEGRHWLRRALAQPAPEKSEARGQALYADASLALAEGDFASAEPKIDEIEEVAAALGSVDLSAREGWLRLCWHMYRAEVPEALKWADTVLTMLAPGRLPAIRMDTLMCKASTAASAGDMQVATAACKEMESECAAAGEVFHRGYALWLRGVLALGAGDPASAVQLEREGLRLRTVIGEATGTGWSLEMLAWAEGASGQPQRAATLLGAADRLWEAAGRPFDTYQHWAPFHAQCESDALSVLGSAGYRRAFDLGRSMSMEDALAYALGAAVRQPDPVLSSRETEIAELIAAGLTNREIGQRLYISERTVDGHVQRIFKKLDVRSRAEVSRRLAALKNEDAEPVDAV